MMNYIAGPVDREISTMLQKEYAARGVEFILGAKVTSIKDKTVTYEKDGKSVALPADYALVSIGRRPRTTGIGCENIGLKLERGAIVTNEYGKTNVPGVWAAGDVNGKSMLAHTAYREGEVCINNILGKKDRINYNSIPSVIYTNPEVASVGETTESCKAKGLDVKIDTVTLKYSGRYVAENEHGNGVVKIITDKKHNNIIGVHMIGSYASEIIYGAAMMVETEMRVSDVQKLVFPHPTVCEVIREAMFM
jgi:dihydrolipoamide dehydrogenase